MLKGQYTPKTPIDTLTCSDDGTGWSCCERFHGGTIFFPYRCTEGSTPPLTDRRLANGASWGYSLAEEDTINVYIHWVREHNRSWVDARFRLHGATAGRCSLGGSKYFHHEIAHNKAWGLLCRLLVMTAWTKHCCYNQKLPNSTYRPL